METFITIVEAVQENNEINDGSWSDWKDVYHLENIYGTIQEKNKDLAVAFLSELIDSNGRYLEKYIKLWDAFI